MRPTVKLWEICDILDKKRKPITQKDRTKWIYPYYWASWILDYVADYIFDEDLVLIWEDWAKWGALDNSAFKVSWKVWVNNHAHVIRPHREKILDDYLVYYLVSSDLSDYITWTTVPKLNQERLKLIEIPLPPLETQKAIVAKLDQIFAELDQTKSEIQKNLDNTDELWKSAYDRILSIKWDEKSLEDLCEIVDYRWKTPKKTDKWILLVTAKNIRKWYIDYEKSKEYISEDDYDEVMHRWLPKIWDILFTTEAPCWNVAIIDNENIALAQRVVKYRPKNKEYLNNKYLLYVLLWNEFQKKLEMHSTWWTVKWIKWKILHKLTIPVPPLSEQEKIVEHLDQVSKEVKELKSKYQFQLDNLEELKKSVLDKAFKWELVE